MYGEQWLVDAVCTSHGKVMRIPHLSVKEMDSILCKEKVREILERKTRFALGYKRGIQWLVPKEKGSGLARVGS